MHALAVLFYGFESLKTELLFSVYDRVRHFVGLKKIVLLTHHELQLPVSIEQVVIPQCTVPALLKTLAQLSVGFDFIYFAWADCPFLDPLLAEALAKRHQQYRADYSYADGYPYGLAPELIAPRTVSLLVPLAQEKPIERDALFSVLQKDINAFDIEVILSPVDLRGYRLSFTSDSKRKQILIDRFNAAGATDAVHIQKVIEKHPEWLRTVPAFYPIQVSGLCPQACSWCPYPQSEQLPKDAFMDVQTFSNLLDRIIDFSADAVIDLSLWGELSLHPQKILLIQAVLARPALSLIIESSGIGWTDKELEQLAADSSSALPRINRQPPLSWIISLDTHNAARYREIRGEGFEEATTCAERIAKLFPQDTYVQAVRTRGAEDDIEHFYRSWKEKGVQTIIQKYDSFCGQLVERSAADLSPIVRRPCWHLGRDMPILLDGTVPICKEELLLHRLLGNAFREELCTVWSRAEALYNFHCTAAWGETGQCAVCDEYYTYNF
ncbi:MAG: spiro-SPASM protein [Treponema sp.]|jgi:spiro-SPASM protein|nr:spiro-SPASM protein [Treponema sp.]